jgi:hypothetical protein
MEFIKDTYLDWPVGTLVMSFLTLVVLLLLLYITITAVDYFGSKTEILHVTVIEKSCSASSTGVGVGPSFSSSGNVGSTVVVTSNPEKFILFLKGQDRSFDIEVSRDYWLERNKGDELDIEVRIGRLTNDVVGWKIL